MDNDIVYTVSHNSQTVMRINCRCGCIYFHIELTSNMDTNSPFYSISFIGRGFCIKCSQFINLYNSDLIKQIGKLRWITI